MHGAYVCWPAREDDDHNHPHKPHHVLDGSEDNNVVSSHIPELDCEHEEHDDSAGDFSDVDLMYMCLLLHKRKWVHFQG